MIVIYYVYKDSQSQWRWRLVAANRKIIAESSESYWNRQDCLYSIQLVKNSNLAPVYDA